MSCTHPQEKILITEKGFYCKNCKETMQEWDLIKDNYNREDL